ncbi:MAG: hypothetical protein WAV72_09310, partial [Bradyrhizobium sp.]
MQFLLLWKFAEPRSMKSAVREPLSFSLESDSGRRWLFESLHDFPHDVISLESLTGSLNRGLPAAA